MINSTNFAPVQTTQPNGKDLFIDTPGVFIYDNVYGGFVKQHRIIRNTQSEWVKVAFDNGTIIDATIDHPFEIIGKGVVHAEDLTIGDATYYRIEDGNKAMAENFPRYTAGGNQVQLRCNNRE